ncbi:MAG: hypothetical protein B7X86_06610 [Sphingobacteriales bacterium 17-39-43]|nr:MAG: hypothetical protein B7Y69_11810 [Sphingobacteriia bacterium 35-40-8]OYZ31665.1 MAG: hypothetical protein B7Y24_07425 [Sphingobacteriales bacterium 16-39-50]OZA25060.1 MAG: hypothetical protein B7X86_06610 [Sphingobacteriales bacterium 17-39-43]OZA59560.1 MAG: hypothetical protein B7X75_04000 [Sphingobacteriales bacterium 39-40-5]
MLSEFKKCNYSGGMAKSAKFKGKPVKKGFVKNYKKPLWMKMIRMVFLELLCVLILVAIITKFNHSLIHWGVE